MRQKTRLCNELWRIGTIPQSLRDSSYGGSKRPPYDKGAFKSPLVIAPRKKLFFFDKTSQFLTFFAIYKFTEKVYYLITAYPIDGHELIRWIPSSYLYPTTLCGPRNRPALFYLL